MLKLWVQQLGIRPALACADSNVAVDNMAVALVAAGLSIVRVGRQEAIRSELHAHMPDALGGNSAIATADVVLCTCVGAGSDSFKKLEFAAVLIDETAQACSCLTAHAHGTPCVRAQPDAAAPSRSRRARPSFAALARAVR